MVKVLLVSVFFSSNLTANTGEGELQDLGEFAFAALPSAGDRFTVWLRKKLTTLEVVSVSQSPAPVRAKPENEPNWPPEREEPSVHVSARVV